MYELHCIQKKKKPKLLLLGRGMSTRATLKKKEKKRKNMIIWGSANLITCETCGIKMVIN